MEFVVVVFVFDVLLGDSNLKHAAYSCMFTPRRLSV
jgi:hypothetical protein